MKDFALSRQDTAVLKGIAICAMLLHHLYYSSPVGIVPYSGVLSWLGNLGKVCVSIFLFCSGYGLASNYSRRKETNIRVSAAFVAKRFLKFYTSYWVVLLIFVPISIFVFGRTFEVAYGEWEIPKRIVFEWFAINGFSSYNITWWFNAVIVVLYLLFPLLFWLSRKLGMILFVLCLALFRLCNHIPGNVVDVYLWQFPFMLGVFWSLWESKMPKAIKLLSEHNYVSIAAIVLLLLLLIFLRMEPIIPHWQGIRMDSFIILVLAMLVVLWIEKVSGLSMVLAFLGKHSMNIYLIHTFFNGYWHPEWLHTGWGMRSGLNFVVLLSICLVISLLLEWMKEKIGVYSLVNKLSEKLPS